MVARYAANEFGVSAAEIVDYHASSKQIFVVNAKIGRVDILDGSLLETATPVSIDQALLLNNLLKVADVDVVSDINLSRLGGVNSISIYQDLLAVAVERGDEQGNDKQGKGLVAFYQLSDDGAVQYMHQVEVGYLPDNLVFTPNGQQLLVANEGEPNEAYSVDPVGSVSISILSMVGR
ncbi:choice-of-anchor I domain-containing protein [Shewanella surugensis]|uniref:Choice-of-anchor I domain-containing protein n=1 Tax=Shewanella surugensis TaxID=212020 RepID=A0ABT0L6X3_9GAMM|nr:hypothetical protein [Shewanella surugensis]MCL1123442.1 hypothetical protein [Shewanella surugensis]